MLFINLHKAFKYKTFKIIYMSSQSSKELPIVTFNSLYNILKQEERVFELHSLPNHFYEATDEFIKQKKQESKNSEDLKLQNKLKTAQKIFLKLKQLRAKKIAQLVIYNSQDFDNVLDTESEFREHIKKAFDSTYLK